MRNNTRRKNNPLNDIPPSNLLQSFPLSEEWKESSVVILGIGNELNGDDAAGVQVARLLAKIQHEREQLSDPRSQRFHVFDGGAAPEAFTGPIRRCEPALVVLVDAAELGELPGTVQCFDWSIAQGMSASTHTLPPSMLARFLVEQVGCRVVLIGIQPKQLEFDAGMSPEVQGAVHRVVGELTALLNGR